MCPYQADADSGVDRTSSLARYHALREWAADTRPGEGRSSMSAALLKRWLSSAPVFRREGTTLASMVFEPTARRMHIRFKNESGFAEYRL